VHRIDVREQSDGRAVAYLYADESQDAGATRQQLRTSIRQKGWGTLSDFRDGAYALRISGLSNAQELLDLVAQTQAVTGAPSVTSQDVQDKPSGIGETIKNNSLRVSAIGYTLGNALYYLSGIPTGNQERKKMAIAFGVGDAALGVFGGRNDTFQYQSLLTKLQGHFEKTGIEIPKTASIHIETSSRGQSLGTRTASFMHNHINSIKMSAEVLGGFFAFRSGSKAFKNQKNLANAAEMLGGAIVVAGWSGALLTPEKKRDPEALKDASTVQRFASYVQEKPTRLAGWAGYCFNLVGGYNFLTKRGTAEGKWGLGAIGAMVGSNTLYAMSHKAPGGDIKTDAMVSDVYIVAAQILNKQPESLREAAIEATAKFLGERPEIKDSRQEINLKLREQITIQRNSPWFEDFPLPAYTPQPKHARVAIRNEGIASNTFAESAAGLPQEASPERALPLPVIQAGQVQHTALQSEPALAERA